MEWNNNNKYNSFNSMKGLLYYEHYRNTLAWLDGKEKLLPPVECNLDPFAECNLKCSFCIGQRYLRNHREEVGEMRVLPENYIWKLVIFLANWGVKGLCISGGGEPSLHEGIAGLPSFAKETCGMDVSFVSNGVNLKNTLIHNMMYCRWVSFSVDAADRETYKKIKGADKFDAVIRNIKRVTERRKLEKSQVDVAYKYLILPENQYSIFNACKLAKELGVQDFHARPCDFERMDIEGHKKLNIDVKKVHEQFDQCHEIEDESFHVYTITHKFDPEFHVKHDFSRCYATLILPILTDGNAYLCVDKKMEAKYRIGSAYPNPEQILEWWGSDAHRELIKSVDINQCSRCTGGQYNAQIENVVLQDKMCLSFP